MVESVPESSGSPAARPRGMFGEFLIVMLGVLVALALEQMVSNWQEQRRVDATIQAMDEELLDFSVVFRIRQQVSPCAVAKLDALDAALTGEAGGTVLSSLGRPPYFFSSRGGWNSGGSELLSRHLGPRIARTYGEAYQGMEEFAVLAQLEQQYWAQLQPLEGQLAPGDPERRWKLREAVAAARNANLLLTAIAEQMLGRIDEVVAELPSDELPMKVLERPICQPLGGSR